VALEPTASDRVDLAITIEKRKRPRIESISFVGNHTVPSSELRGSMKMKETGWTTRWTGGDRFDETRLETDIESLRNLYLKRGHLSVEVGPVEIEPKPDAGISLTIPIQEGPVFRTETISIEPGFLFDEETILGWLSLERGAAYDATAVREVKPLIERRYRDRSYGAVQIEVKENPDPVTHGVNLSIQVHPGPLYLFGRIEFRGNERTRDLDLRQYLKAHDRDRFRQSAIETDVRALPALGLVQSLAPETQIEDRNVVDVTYHVEELPRFEYFLGGGANGVQGASGAINFLARDLLGQGETWNFDGEVGNRLGNFTAGFQDAFSIGHRLSWGASLVRQKIEYPDETSDDFTRFSIALSGPGGSRFRFQTGFQTVGFRLTSTLTTPVAFLTPFLDQRFQTNRIHLDLGYDGRNPSVFPTKGFQTTINIEAVGGLLGGDVNLTKLRARTQYVIPLDPSSRRHLISLRGRAESVWPFGTTTDDGLPRFERLFLGSEDDLRGFPIREVGPKTQEGVPIGGDRAVFASAEYQFVASPRTRLVAFFDLGNVYATDLPDQALPALRFDAGAEFRILAPILNLPLRLGYGFNLDPLPDEPRGRLFFSLSARF
jgi:outer membrane protein insertion porin family